MQLEIPQTVLLSDGTTAQVKGIAAKVDDGVISRIVYTVEKESGAWAELESEQVNPLRKEPNE